MVRYHFLFFRLVLITLSIFLLSPSVVEANFVINGSFEDNSAMETEINLSNAEFNATVANLNAFGTDEQLDLLALGNIYGPDPVGGSWHVGLSSADPNSTDFDAFSFELTEALVVGTQYDLNFFATAHVTLSAPGTDPLEIGVSNDPNSFGTLFYTTGQLNDDSWTEYFTSFFAPISGQHLTVRPSGAGDAWVHADNFSLSLTVPEPNSLLLLGTLFAVHFARRPR